MTGPNQQVNILGVLHSMQYCDCMVREPTQHGSSAGSGHACHLSMHQQAWGCANALKSSTCHKHTQGRTMVRTAHQLRLEKIPTRKEQVLPDIRHQCKSALNRSLCRIQATAPSMCYCHRSAPSTVYLYMLFSAVCIYTRCCHIFKAGAMCGGCGAGPHGLAAAQ